MSGCEHCGGELPTPAVRVQGGGRRRRFCSSRCRVAEHRLDKRRRASRQPTLHEALGTEPANSGTV